MNEMQWKTLALADLRPAAYNPRKKLKAGDKEYEKIKSSMRLLPRRDFAAGCRRERGSPW